MADKERKAIVDEARRLFHELWTEEVGTEKYTRERRKKWMDLQWVLTELGVPV